MVDRFYNYILLHSRHNYVDLRHKHEHLRFDQNKVAVMFTAQLVPVPHSSMKS